VTSLFSRVTKRIEWELAGRRKWESLCRQTRIAHTRKDGLEFLFFTDDVIGLELFRTGNYSKGTLLDAIALVSRISPGCLEKVFFDIGANIGTTSVTAVRNGGFRRAVAVEPNPENFRLLSTNISWNRLDDVIRPMNVALSSEKSRAHLSIVPRNCGMGRVVVGGKGMPSVEVGTIEVDATTVDDLLHDLSLNPEEIGFAWIDVQGHEGHVLAGAQSLLDVGVPMCLELWPQGLSLSGGIEGVVSHLARHYTHFVDLRDLERKVCPISVLPQVGSRLEGEAFTDVLVYRQL
jgi:FkbM family methyltransferase